MEYPVTVERQADGRYRIVFPDFPGAEAVGADEADGLGRARDVLAAALGKHIRERRAIPSPSPVRTHHVTVPALIEAKMRLYDLARATNIGKAELARRLGWHMPQVDRLFDVRHGSRLEQLEAAFAALGKRLVVEVLDEGASADPGPQGARQSKSTAPRSADRPAPAGPAPAFEVQWD